jgi:hypothetical protein
MQCLVILDLQTLLIQNIKSGNQLKGSTEEWTKAASDESKRVLENIGNVIKTVFEPIEIQFTNWVRKNCQNNGRSVYERG